MKRKLITEHISKVGVIAVVRLEEPLPLKPITSALYSGGITVIEITLTTPDALTIMEELKQFHGPEVLIGAGSVTSKKQIEEVAFTGADFIVSPITKKEIIEEAHLHDLPVFPGALTPTEVQMAYEYGADMIKIFPAIQLGVGYIRALQAPLPHVRLVPTGGITPENAGEWIRAGAAAVGIGSALINEEVIINHRISELTDRASIVCKNIAKARHIN